MRQGRFWALLGAVAAMVALAAPAAAAQPAVTLPGPLSAPRSTVAPERTIPTVPKVAVPKATVPSLPRAGTSPTAQPSSKATSRQATQARASTSTNPPGPDRDCKDFPNRQAAQRYFDRNGGSPSNDVDRLDADGNGRACETFFASSSPSSAASSAPAGGPNTGLGGTAVSGHGTLLPWLSLALGVILLLGAGASARRARRSM